MPHGWSTPAARSSTVPPAGDTREIFPSAAVPRPVCVKYTYVPFECDARGRGEAARELGLHAARLADPNDAAALAIGPKDLGRAERDPAELAVVTAHVEIGGGVHACTRVLAHAVLRARA